VQLLGQSPAALNTVVDPESLPLWPHGSDRCMLQARAPVLQRRAREPRRPLSWHSQPGSRSTCLQGDLCTRFAFPCKLFPTPNRSARLPQRIGVVAEAPLRVATPSQLVHMRHGAAAIYSLVHYPELQKGPHAILQFTRPIRIEKGVALARNQLPRRRAHHGKRQLLVISPDHNFNSGVLDLRTHACDTVLPA
jgi:hypothetical protein